LEGPNAWKLGMHCRVRSLCTGQARSGSNSKRLELKLQICFSCWGTCLQPMHLHLPSQLNLTSPPRCLLGPGEYTPADTEDLLMHDKDLLRQQQLSERGRWAVLCVPEVAEDSGVPDCIIAVVARSSIAICCCIAVREGIVLPYFLTRCTALAVFASRGRCGTVLRLRHYFALSLLPVLLQA
jgi:hypothetical protein